eukprot:5324830-Pleurochrysis_carterae.AAC.1
MTSQKTSFGGGSSEGRIGVEGFQMLGIAHEGGGSGHQQAQGNADRLRRENAAQARLDVSSAEERKLSKASGHQTYCVPFGCATPLFVILHAVLLVWADDAEQKVYFVVLLRRFIRPRPAPREPSLASFIRRLLLHLLNSLFALAPSPTRLLALSFPNPAR